VKQTNAGLSLFAAIDAKNTSLDFSRLVFFICYAVV